MKKDDYIKELGICEDENVVSTEDLMDNEEDIEKEEQRINEL